MATLHENTLNFNKKMTVTNTGGNLSTDAGLVLVKEFLYSIGFEQLMEKELHFQDSRLLPTIQIVLPVIAFSSARLCPKIFF